MQLYRPSQSHPGLIISIVVITLHVPVAVRTPWHGMILSKSQSATVLASRLIALIIATGQRESGGKAKQPEPHSLSVPSIHANFLCAHVYGSRLPNTGNFPEEPLREY